MSEASPTDPIPIPQVRRKCRRDGRSEERKLGSEFGFMGGAGDGVCRSLIQEIFEGVSEKNI